MIDVDPIKQYYFKVDDLINTFNITIGGVNGVTFTNNYNINDYNDCNLGITTTNLVSADFSSVYVTNSVKLSTINDEIFTFTYFTTGSLIIGFTPVNQEIFFDGFQLGSISEDLLYSIKDDILAPI